MDVRFDAYSRNHDIGLNAAITTGADDELFRLLLDPLDPLVEKNVNAPFSEIDVQEVRQGSWEDPLTDAGARKDQRYLPSIHGKRRSNLRSDEAAPNNDKFGSVTGRLPGALEIGQPAKVDN